MRVPGETGITTLNGPLANPAGEPVARRPFS
jgi:hypothetical protein